METAVSRSARNQRAWAPSRAAVVVLALSLLPALHGSPARAQDAQAPAAKAAALLQRLRAQVAAADARLDGVLGVYVEDLASGARVVELRADEAFPTASSIKPAVLYELYRQAAEGRIELDETTRPPLPRVGGGGVLQELGPHLSLSWRDLAVLMMAWSDNEATNLLIRRLGMDAVNRRLDSLALARTRLRREMMDLAAARRGDENVSTPRELARLAGVVARGEGLPAERGRDLLAVATVPADGSPFRRALPVGVRAISKPGSLEGVRCEMAWVEVPGRPYLAAIMTGYLEREADGEALIQELSAAIYSTFDRLARSSDHGRVISERDARK
jgi:beta-lactamase class A